MIGALGPVSMLKVFAKPVGRSFIKGHGHLTILCHNWLITFRLRGSQESHSSYGFYYEILTGVQILRVVYKQSWLITTSEYVMIGISYMTLLGLVTMGVAIASFVLL